MFLLQVSVLLLSSSYFYVASRSQASVDYFCEKGIKEIWFNTYYQYEGTTTVYNYPWLKEWTSKPNCKKKYLWEKFLWPFMWLIITKDHSVFYNDKKVKVWSILLLTVLIGITFSLWISFIKNRRK